MGQPKCNKMNLKLRHQKARYVSLVDWNTFWCNREKCCISSYVRNHSVRGCVLQLESKYNNALFWITSVLMFQVVLCRFSYFELWCFWWLESRKKWKLFRLPSVLVNQIMIFWLEPLLMIDKKMLLTLSYKGKTVSSLIVPLLLNTKHIAYASNFVQVISPILFWDILSCNSFDEFFPSIFQFKLEGYEAENQSTCHVTGGPKYE